jgi:anti-sigma factor RsiW
MKIECPLKSESSIGENSLDLLLDYSAGKLDGEPNKARRIALEDHMAECSDCAAFRVGQAEVWQALDVWEPEPVSMDFNRRLWQKIDSAAAAPWYRKLADSLRMGAWKPALPLTAAVFLVAAGFMMDHRNVLPNSATPSVAMTDGVSVSEADQVEKTLDDIQLLRQLDAGSGNSSNSSTM